MTNMKTNKYVNYLVVRNAVGRSAAVQKQRTTVVVVVGVSALDEKSGRASLRR